MEQIDAHKSSAGRQLRFRHRAQSVNCDMTFSVYLPPQADSGQVPVLYWLSGLTCTDENFVQKAGAQAHAARHGIALVAPDTSPRGEGVPDDPDGSYDFGLGAGFYGNARQEPWRGHYQMHDYVAEELPRLLQANLPMLDTARSAISGHSMGGHGALTIGLGLPGRFRSISAFAPICSPTRCPWGEKAFSGYLGGQADDWLAHDATHLILSAQHCPLLVDQGEADEFLTDQLKPELLTEAAAAAGFPLTLRMQPGYDHSYFFIASFIGSHIEFHASHLQ